MCGGAGRCVFCDNHSDERGEERERVGLLG